MDSNDLIERFAEEQGYIHSTFFKLNLNELNTFQNEFLKEIRNTKSFWHKLFLLYGKYVTARTDDDKIACLKEILKIDTNNRVAQAWLISLEEKSSEKGRKELTSLVDNVKKELSDNYNLTFTNKDKISDYCDDYKTRAYVEITYLLLNNRLLAFDFNESEQLLENILELDPRDFFDVKGLLACVYYKLKHFDKGVLFLKANKDNDLTCALVYEIYSVETDKNPEDSLDALLKINKFLPMFLTSSLYISDQEMDSLFDKADYSPSSLVAALRAVNRFINYGISSIDMNFLRPFAKLINKYNPITVIDIHTMNLLFALYGESRFGRYGNLTKQNINNMFKGSSRTLVSLKKNQSFGMIKDQKSIDLLLSEALEEELINMPFENVFEISTEGTIIITSAFNHIETEKALKK